MWDSMKRWWRYLGAKVGLRLEEHADPKVQLEQAIREAQRPAPAPPRAGDERHRQPEADRAPARAGDRGLRARQRVGPFGARPRRRGGPRRAQREGGLVQPGGGGIRQQDREPRGPGQPAPRAAARDFAGVREGEGRGGPELDRAAEEARRTSAAAEPARPGPHARRDEQGDGPALRVGLRRRAHLRRGAGQGREAPRPRPGRHRDRRCERGHEDARGRAGADERRGAGEARVAAG